MNPQMLEDLKAPFPPKLIERKGTGRADDYVNHAVVTDRLNRVAPDWTFSIVHIETYVGKDGKPHVAGITGVMTIGLSKREEAGDVEREERYGAELKNAVSDCVKRCAMRFGVAIQLWHELETSGAGGPAAADLGEGSSVAQPAPEPSSGSGQDVAARQQDPAPTADPDLPSKPVKVMDLKAQDLKYQELVRLCLDHDFKIVATVVKVLKHGYSAKEIPGSLSIEDLQRVIDHVNTQTALEVGS